MARAVRNWLLRQLNSKDVLDGVTVTVKLAVEELGAKTVASELRRITKQLERTGSVQGWKFPRAVKDVRQRRAGDAPVAEHSNSRDTKSGTAQAQSSVA